MASRESLWNKLITADNILRLMVVLVFAAYTQTVTYELVWDDFLLITMNPWLHSAAGLKAMFTHQSFGFLDYSIVARYYRPMFLVWLWIVQNVFGPAPGWFHLAAIFSHLVACFLAYRLAFWLLQGERIPAALVAILFALHPTRSETIGWIAAANECVAAAFVFGSLLAYLNARRSARPFWWISLSLVCYAGAMLTKESAVMVPALVIAYEFLVAPSEGGRLRNGKLLMYLGTMAVALGLFLAVRTAVLGGAGEAIPTSIRTTILTAPLASCLLLRQVVWPFGLSEFYPTVLVTHFSWARFVVPCAILIAVAAVYWQFARKSPVLMFSAAWFAALALPVVAEFRLLQLHDRYVYLPSFGAALALVVLAGNAKRPAWIGDRSLALGTVVLALVFAVASAYEVRIWRSSITLFTRGVEVAPNNLEAINLLAESYVTYGRVEEAVEVLRHGLAIAPNSARLNYSIASDLARLDRIEEATAYYQKLFSLPFDATLTPGAHFELAMVEWKRGNLTAAQQHLQLAVDQAPNSAQYRNAMTRLRAALAESSDARIRQN